MKNNALAKVQEMEQQGGVQDDLAALLKEAEDEVSAGPGGV